MSRKICFFLMLLCITIPAFGAASDFWSAWHYNSDNSRTELTAVDIINNTYSGVEVSGEGLSQLSYMYMSEGISNYFGNTVTFTLELKNVLLPSSADCLYVYLNNNVPSAYDDGTFQQHTGWGKWILKYSDSSTGNINGTYTFEITNSPNLVAGTYATGGAYYQDAVDVLNGIKPYDYIIFDNIKIFFAGNSTKTTSVGQLTTLNRGYFFSATDDSSITISGFDINAQHAPEPTSLVLAACGLVSLIGLSRRRSMNQ